MLDFAIAYTDIGPKVGHIPGMLNLANTISWGDLAVKIPEKVGHLTATECHACLQVQMASTSACLQCFQPAPAELLLALESAILQKSVL